MHCLLQGEFKKLNDDTYTLKYENDYALDYFLGKGVKNVADLARTVQKHFGGKKA